MIGKLTINVSPQQGQNGQTTTISVEEIEKVVKENVLNFLEKGNFQGTVQDLDKLADQYIQNKFFSAFDVSYNGDFEMLIGNMFLNLFKNNEFFRNTILNSHEFTSHIISKKQEIITEYLNEQERRFKEME